ncbi:MAG TPA: phosphoribosylaminoimidazolesuccinocarboxamide synthase [Ilumatobacteraceae bacterium]|nr:phosphoribosylaminoimidazolesuccinocarboxamide synthase [Ilumatobacteraceae bacterium]
MIAPFLDIDLALPDRREGKVRVSYSYGEGQRLFITTDRLSAFDRVIAGVAYKGQVLNQLSGWWFEHTADVVANHIVGIPDPNVLIARTAQTLPVEVVVRAYITGVTSTSLWRQYADGARTIYGYRFAEGLRKNSELPSAIITPTTKAEHGAHDEPLSPADVVSKGLVPSARWSEVEGVALELFRRGHHLARQSGLILADTKYEFGTTPDGELLLIDELHTPDSSRYWIAESYEARLAAGEEPESLDKETVRRALIGAGYKGHGEPPALDPGVWEETSRRYIDAYERLTGLQFDPGSYPVEDRIKEAFGHGS